MMPSNSHHLETTVNDLCVSLLLRMVRRDKDSLDIERPSIRRRDVEALKLYWAMSDEVRRLAERISDYPREAQQILVSEIVETEGNAVGGIDARESVFLQTVRGNPAVFVVENAQTTFDSDANHLVAWTLREAHRTLSWADRSRETPFDHDVILQTLKPVDGALRSLPMRESLGSSRMARPPGQQAARAVSRSRNPLYRMALDAFRLLRGVEALDIASLQKLFRNSLLPSLELWRRFELAVVLSTVESFSKACQEAPEIDLKFTNGKPIARVGDYAFYWQYNQPRRSEDRLDRAERIARRLMEYLGVRYERGRIDLAVLHSRATIPIAMIECKWNSGVESRDQSISDAVSQIVEYALDAIDEPEDAPLELLSRSLVMLSDLGNKNRLIEPDGPINLGDVNALQEGALDAWADRVIQYTNRAALI